MEKQIGRLNARIPLEELTALRTWCAAHDKTVSRVLTGMIHTFNVRQRKLDEQETEKLCRSIEKASHLKARAFKEQGRQMLRDSEPSLSDGLPLPDLDDERSRDGSMAGGLRRVGSPARFAGGDDE